MNAHTSQKVVLLVTVALLLIAWAFVMWIAIVVSQTMLDTLTLIIDLAAISP